MKKVIIFLISTIIVFGYSQKAFALGECGLSCCVASAMGAGGVTNAQNFGLSLQYEYTYMETIREGHSEISPDKVLDNKAATWPMMPMEMKRFSVPTEMKMQKYSLIATVPVTEKLQFLAIVPYVINDMKMRMIERDMMGMDMKMEHTMDTVKGLGDIVFMGLYTPYQDAPVRPTQRLTLGLGVKTPSGKNDETTSSGSLVHAMMQPGTGSWDPLFMANYMHAFYPLVLQANLLYQLTTEGDKGYEFGDKLTVDLIARYQVANYVNLGLALNGLWADNDKDHDGRYSKPTTSLVDNTDNTGITALYITPEIQVKIPNTGGSADLKFQVPLYQDTEGIQQVVDWRVLASISWNF